MQAFRLYFHDLFSVNFVETFEGGKGLKYPFLSKDIPLQALTTLLNQGVSKKFSLSQLSTCSTGGFWKLK